jgi:2-keto-4-pentenoate hydratase/2-oxohepta-3-ene-1,7-dioic acid hydratase in catechol pathway
MDCSFALGTFAAGTGPIFAGLVLGDAVFSIEDLSRRSRPDGLPVRTSVRQLVRAWDRCLPRLAALAEFAQTFEEWSAPGPWPAPLCELTIHPPIHPPGAVFAAGANYRSHVRELAIAEGRMRSPQASEHDLAAAAERWMDERHRTGEPYVFLGLPRAVVGARAAVVLPAQAERCDWELELACVIGRGGRRIPREKAFDHVAGYTIANDLTARDWVLRSDSAALGGDWLRAKSQPSFFPIGPLLVPRAFVPDPARLRIQLRLNGEVMQDASTSDMLFDIPQLVAYVSSITPLEPGDVILTGSPPGNGAHWNRYLRPGDLLEGEITGLGVQRNRCVAEADAGDGS